MAKNRAEVKVDTGIEARARQKQHQVKMREGSLIAPERKLTEAELGLALVKRRKQKHQTNLRGGI